MSTGDEVKRDINTELHDATSGMIGFATNAQEAYKALIVAFLALEVAWQKETPWPTRWHGEQLDIAMESIEQHRAHLNALGILLRKHIEEHNNEFSRAAKTMTKIQEFLISLQDPNNIEHKNIQDYEHFYYFGKKNPEAMEDIPIMTPDSIKAQRALVDKLQKDYDNEKKEYEKKQEDAKKLAINKKIQDKFNENKMRLDTKTYPEWCKENPANRELNNFGNVCNYLLYCAERLLPLKDRYKPPVDQREAKITIIQVLNLFDRNYKDMATKVRMREIFTSFINIYEDGIKQKESLKAEKKKEAIAKGLPPPPYNENDALPG
jgi:hypothetical protein